MMKIDEAITYIHRTSWQGSRLGLERIRELLDRMGNPQNRLKFIHVAGTNGKGSICAMLSSILTQAGYKTGLYISPYIQRFNERIQVDGVQISDDDLVSITEQVGVYAEQMEDCPTEFELTTAMAMSYFENVCCDIVVLEVGLGGRLDATNSIPVPEVAVIASIGLDHKAELGDTLEKIAAEKAGIIKPGGDVVLYPQTPGVEALVEGACKKVDAFLSKVSFDSLRIESSTLSGHCFNYDGWVGLKLPLAGSHQPVNAATVLMVASVLRLKGWTISDDAVRIGLDRTVWPARFEVVHQCPYVIVDGGHNPQCVDSIVSNLRRYFPGRKVTFLFGVMADKDYDKMLDMILPYAAFIITVTADNPRALPAEYLAKHIQIKGFPNVVPGNSIEEGMKLAINTVREEDVICAFGSFYMAGAIRTYFGLN